MSCVLLFELKEKNMSEAVGLISGSGADIQKANILAEQTNKKAEFEQNYQKFGSVWVQNGLFKSLEITHHGDASNLTLSDGTTVAFPNFGTTNPSIISKEADDGVIIFENFNNVWTYIEGTNGPDKYIIKNSAGVQVNPKKGNDEVVVDNSKSSLVHLKDNDEYDQVYLYNNNHNCRVSAGNVKCSPELIQTEDGVIFNFYGK